MKTFKKYLSEWSSPEQQEKANSIHSHLKKLGTEHSFVHGGMHRETTTSFYGKNQHHDTVHKLATDSGYKHVEKASALNNHVDTYHKELGDGRNVASISVHKSMNDPKHVTKVATQVKEKKW